MPTQLVRSNHPKLQRKSENSLGLEGGRLDSQFVSREEFLKLLVSRKQLLRIYDSENCVRGLLDTKAGKRFLIRQENLMPVGDSAD